MSPQHRQDTVVAVLADKAHKVGAHVLKELLLFQVENLKRRPRTIKETTLLNVAVSDYLLFGKN